MMLKYMCICISDITDAWKMMAAIIKECRTADGNESKSRKAVVKSNVCSEGEERKGRDIFLTGKEIQELQHLGKRSSGLQSRTAAKEVPSFLMEKILV